MDERFNQHIIKVYGEQGQQWLKQLPSLITKLSKEWNLENLVPVKNLSYNYVLQGYQNTCAIILKIGVQKQTIENERHALEHFNGNGVIELLNYNQNALLLAQAVPGNSLKNYFPEHELAAIEIAANVITKLHKTALPTHQFPELTQLLQQLDYAWPIPHGILAKARYLRQELLASTKQVVLLHGDLHHDNILEHQGRWLAIDPKGVIGDFHYEFTAFIHNPMPELVNHPCLKETINQRIITFAKLFNTKALRIKNWCFVQATLAWIWAIEDRDAIAIEYFQKIVQMLAIDEGVGSKF